jgi:hypothetical protein
MNATIITAFASLVLIAPAQAEPTTTAAAATTAAASQPDTAAPVRSAKTRYCYNTESTGSHIIRRECHTRAEWKEMGVKVPERL